MTNPFYYYIPGLQPSKGAEFHLMGIDRVSMDNGYTEPNYYLLTLLILLGLNLVAFGNYYYGVLNRPGMDRKRWWFLHVLVLSVLVYGIAFSFPYNMLRSNNLNKELPFTAADAHLFALESALCSVFASFAFTLLLKWKSRNNKFVPF